MFAKGQGAKGDLGEVHWVHVHPSRLPKKKRFRMELNTNVISINTQVIIQNRALSLARYLGLSADNHLDGQNGRQ